MSRRRRVKEETSQGGGEWRTTYGDLVTLLLTFFVLLFSFSTIDAQKWQGLVLSLTGGAGILDGGNAIDGEDVGAYNINIDDDILMGRLGNNQDNNIVDGENIDDFVKLYQEIDFFLKERDIPAEVEISEEYTEILIRFKDSILFDTGKADIKPEALEILDGIAVVLKTYQDEIDQVRVEGHADSRPINTYLYPTNWELSSKRAINVVRYFHEEKGIEPSKLSAAAYGPYHPIDTNNTEEGMARNRRVEFYIVRSVEPIGEINTEKE